MCGIFGVIGDTVPVARLLTLAAFAQTRGTDGAGIARIRRTLTKPAPDDLHTLHRATVDRIRFDRSTGSITDLVLDRPAAFDKLLDGATAAFGHTRAATTARDALTVTDCSPMPVTDPDSGHTIVGAHNGGVAVTTEEVAARHGATSSEALLRRLAAAGNSPAKILRVLTDTTGRNAVVWASTTDPRTIWIARGARSPLAVATDQRDRTWVASSPDWLARLHDDGQGVRPTSIAMLDEGTLVGVSLVTGQIEVNETFVATMRPRDLLFSSRALYAGLTVEDVRDDVENHQAATIDWETGVPDGWLGTVDDLFHRPTRTDDPADTRGPEDGTPDAAADEPAAMSPVDEYRAYVYISDRDDRQDRHIAEARMICEAVDGREFRPVDTVPNRVDGRGAGGATASSFLTTVAPAHVGQAVIHRCMSGTYIQPDGVVATDYPPHPTIAETV